MTDPYSPDDFDPATEAALALWAQEGWLRAKGIHISLKLGKRVSFDFGGNGRWTPQAMGTDLAVAFAVQGILHLCGAEGFNSLAFILTLALASGLGHGLPGTSSAWARARADGASRPAAFAICLRRARVAIEGRQPNFRILAYATLSVGAIILDKLSNFGPARISQWLGNGAQSLVSMAGSVERGMERSMRRRQDLLSLARSFEEPSLVALSAYRAINDARVRCRWGLAPHLAFILAEPLPAEEMEMRRAHKAWIEQAFDTFDELRAALAEAQAAGSQAWTRPLPGLPSLADMGAALFKRFEEALPDSPGEELPALLASLRAHEESHELGLACSVAASPHSKTRRI